MAYRNGTYVAFDGNGTTSPIEGNIKYFNLLKAWSENSNIEFSFSDSHQKTYQVSDSSKISTLKSRLEERLRNSKNMMVIITDNTSWNRGLLCWEIEKAVDVYKLPLLVVYTKYSKILNVDSHSNEWPKALKERIDNNSAKCIHLPFKKDLILDAISQFSIHDKYPATSKNHYSKETYDKLN